MEGFIIYTTEFLDSALSFSIQIAKFISKLGKSCIIYNYLLGTYTFGILHLQTYYFNFY